VAYITHPVFTIYHNHAPVPMRQLVANLLPRLLPEPLLKVEGLPSFARATVTSQPGRRMVYLLAYVPERRGAAVDMIEEPIEVRDVDVALRVDGAAPRKVYLAPSGEKLECRVEGGYAKVTVPVVKGWAVVVFEE
jgi:hypothetical protein